MGRSFGESMSFGLSPYSAAYYNQMRQDAGSVSHQEYGAKHGKPLNATIEYDRNMYERVRLEVSNGIVAGYEVFWTPAMQNLVASLNSFSLTQGGGFNSR